MEAAEDSMLADAAVEFDGGAGRVEGRLNDAIVLRVEVEGQGVADGDVFDDGGGELGAVLADGDVVVAGPG